MICSLATGTRCIVEKCFLIIGLVHLKRSIRAFKSFGSIVVLPNINQHFCTRSAMSSRAACNGVKFNVIMRWEIATNNEKLSRMAEMKA